jgi:ppGpp synthetase/RelA/SpoT-type nucleotidyltranferase
MITPARILNKYQSVEPYLGPVRNRVRDSLLVLCEREGFALVSRIKELESVSEKVETGRFASWSDIDDLVAFTVVVPQLREESKVLSFLRETFEEVVVRPRGSSLKAPDAFRFDATRFIGRLASVNSVPRPPLFDLRFEVQIRSAFEHAWSVTTHALTYKGSEVSWSKLRLTAQLKAAVEQLDTLVSAFDDATKYIDPSMWPEIEAKAELRTFFASKVESKAIPIELAPKDWSRFVDNVFDVVKAGRDRTDPLEISRLICNDFDAELSSLSPINVPRSLSLWQLTFASLVKSGTIGTRLRKRWPLVTPELEALYPALRAVTPRFDYS